MRKKILTIFLTFTTSIYNLSAFSASDDYVWKNANKILNSHFNQRWHEEGQTGYNNCAGDNNFEIKITNAKIDEFKVVEYEGDASLSSGEIKISISCKITTYNGACVGGVGDGRTKPMIGEIKKSLSVGYVFKGAQFVNLGVLVEGKKGSRTNPVTPIKPIEYSGCGAKTINGERDNILSDSIVTIPTAF